MENLVKETKTLDLALEIYGFMQCVDCRQVSKEQLAKLHDAALLLLRQLKIVNGGLVKYEEIYRKYDGKYGDLVGDFVKILNFEQ